MVFSDFAQKQKKRRSLLNVNWAIQGRFVKIAKIN